MAESVRGRSAAESAEDDATLGGGQPSGAGREQRQHLAKLFARNLAVAIGVELAERVDDAAHVTQQSRAQLVQPRSGGIGGGRARVG